jgi:hypothetical protein
MASAELLKIAHSVEGKVTRVDERAKNIDERVQDVSSDVQVVDKKIQGVGEKVQGVDDKLEQVNRSSFSNLFVHHSGSSDVFTGTQLRDNLLRWLSPPDPSINHNVARKVHHDGTSQWFFQGSIFKEWKFTGSFLWIHGKRAFLLPFIIQQFLTSLNAVAGSGKSILRFVGPVLLPLVLPSGADLFHLVPRSYKISLPCTTRAWSQSLTFISTSGMSINRNSKTCFLLS